MTNAKQGADAEPHGIGPHWTSQWRARYRPGDWLVLAGPTSLVLMQPAAPQWSDLIEVVWEEVVGAASIQELAARLADFRLDAMPDFAAIFWDHGGMRSLVRGAVKLVDPKSGQSVADGQGVQTWTEIGLGDLQQVELRAGEQNEGEQLELPLVIGAVGASRVLLDCSEPIQIRSPQGTFVGDQEALRLLSAPEDSTTGAELVEGPSAESAARTAEPAAKLPGPVEGQTSESATPAAVAAAALSTAAQPEPTVRLDPAESGQTVFASSLPGLQLSDSQHRPVLGVLHPSSGGQVVVDRPVVIGRSPVASRVRSDQLPRLLTVPSPSHDISRTHVQVAPQEGRLVVTDLNSTNGTILVSPDGRRSDLRPGVGVPLEYGSLIDLGDGITIAVDRG
ncbi:FHA domain-containing protein [Microlunatus elymi]|uniref:FHA domain-containing protein n=1 Tax=Microlunatus elymi TaxID=2596828 RepID=A0A516PTU2_9ACTN|nr:FHA domain-containing protein [Microlunatus elymi]QDP94540.1 FHA domain-containing protein [Microlunatus elymi]